jgi:clan AA aspartic protease (TIGR02281 family)
MRHVAAGLALGLSLWALPVEADVYKWTDESGRLHFTQDLSQVPARYRKRAGEQAAQRETSRSPVQTYGATPLPARAAPSGGGPRDAQAPGETYYIRVQRAGTNMMVNVRLNNSVTAPFLIDTGASDVLVPAALAKRLGLSLEGARTQRYSTANGVVEQKVVMLRSVAVGDAVVEDVPASVSDGMSVGLLGLSFFNHFNYNIDAANGVVTLTRNNLAASGHIKGGRSQAQWQSEFGGLKQRIASARDEYENKAEAKSRERRRLEAELAELRRQLDLLEDEADAARVPMSWRD